MQKRPKTIASAGLPLVALRMLPISEALRPEADCIRGKGLQRMKIASSASRGFTLVEVMIVVATIALLAVIAIPNYVRARSQSQFNACINNLRQIDDASQEWAMENRQSATATVSFGDIQPYMKGAVVCPASGSATTFAECYGLTTVSNKPTCKIVPSLHVLPSDSSSLPVAR